MKFEVIKQAEVRKVDPSKLTFTDEFVAGFNEVWNAVKEGHHLDKIRIPFENKAEKNKWAKLAKAYGEMKGIHVGVADVADTKDTTTLHIRMENAKKRDVRIAERDARNKKLEEFKALGGEVKRGRNNAMSDEELDKEIKRLQAEKAKRDADKPQETPKAETPKADAQSMPKRPTVPPVPGPNHKK